ncbi:hypothetical protein AB6E88_20115 [Providencia hangzhouensis]
MLLMNAMKCQMGNLDCNVFYMIDKVQSAQKVQLISNIGTRLPAIYSALGKAMIFNYSDQQISHSFRFDPVNRIQCANFWLNCAYSLTQLVKMILRR